MIKKILNIFILLFLLFFSFVILKYYSSEKNVVYINKSRALYSLKSNDKLPILKNDTSNIIIYKDGLEEFKKKRKKRFWEKLISNNE